jgi:hypothetical protein
MAAFCTLMQSVKSGRNLPMFLGSLLNLSSERSPLYNGGSLISQQPGRKHLQAVIRFNLDYLIL